jgi:hypothetical protein
LFGIGLKDCFRVNWFTTNQGLLNEDQDMLSSTSADVSFEEINDFFAPRLLKNGWEMMITQT